MRTNLFKNFIWLIITCIITLTLPLMGAQAAEISASARVDEKNNCIVVEGSTDLPKENISVVITAPNGEICYVDQLVAAEGGDFAVSYYMKKHINGAYAISLSNSSSSPVNLICNVECFKENDVSDIYFTPNGKGLFQEIYPNGDILANVDVANNANANKVYSMYSAKYENGGKSLLSTGVKHEIVAPNESRKISSDFGNSSGITDFSKVFLWGDNLTPKMEATCYSYDDMFTKTSEWYYDFAPGIIRPDEGTMEFTVNITKPIDEFGSEYNFLFNVLPDEPLPDNKNTLFGIYAPTLPERHIGVVCRRGECDGDWGTNYLLVPYKDFNYTPNEPFNLALTWANGKYLKMYINGVCIGSADLDRLTNEEDLPYSFRVCRGEPYNVSQMKISTRELSDFELQTNPNEAFTKSDDTSVIVTNNLTKRSYYQTTWQLENSYSSLIPVWRTETQCFKLGDDVFYYFSGVNHSSEERVYPVTVEVFNSDGVQVIELQDTVNVASDGKYHIYGLKLTKLDADIYSVKATINGIEYNNCISVMPASDNSVPDGELSNFYGQDILFHNDADYLRDINVRFTRNQTAFAWLTVEPQKGKFNWLATDEYVKRCKDSGIECLAVLGKWPHWAAQEPTEEEKENMNTFHESFTSWKPKDINEWREYVYQTVNRYKDDVKYWEIINEVNFKAPYDAASFTGTNEEYAELLRVAYEAAKEADPGCFVLTSGFSAPVPSSTQVDTELPMMLTKSEYSEGYFDIYNIHGYNGTAVWEDEIASLRKNHPDAEVWMSEFMPMEVSDAKGKAFSNIINEMNFLNLGVSKFFNMGTESDNFIGWENRSPTPCYQATGVFQNSIRKCDSLTGKYSFSNDSALCVKDYFRRTDGKYLSIFVSTIADEIKLKYYGKTYSAYDIFGRTLNAGSGGTMSDVKFNKMAYLVTDEPINVADIEFSYNNLIYNSGFESLSSSGDAENWVKREIGGPITIASDSYSGSNAVSIKSIGDNSYIFQDVNIDTAGTYELSARVKVVGTNCPTVFLRMYDRGLDRIYDVKYDMQVDGEYVDIKGEFNADLSGVYPHAFIVGILDGPGEILVDDVKLIYKN